MFRFKIRMIFFSKYYHFVNAFFSYRLTKHIAKISNIKLLNLKTDPGVTNKIQFLIRSKIYFFFMTLQIDKFGRFLIFFENEHSLKDKMENKISMKFNAKQQTMFLSIFLYTARLN